jgi:hypothetical protein
MGRRQREAAYGSDTSGQAAPRAYTWRERGGRERGRPMPLRVPRGARGTGGRSRAPAVVLGRSAVRLAWPRRANAGCC